MTSTHLIKVNSNAPLPIWNSLPTDVDGTIYSFLDDRSLFLASGVCKGWNQTTLMKNTLKEVFLRARQEVAASIAEGYPKEIVLTLRNRGVSLWRVPVLDLGDRVEREELANPTGHHFSLNRDYNINFLSHADMTKGPLMKFNSRGRVGLAIRLQGHREGAMDRHAFRTMNLVFTIYLAKVNDLSWWRCEQNRQSDGDLHQIYRTIHSYDQHYPCSEEYKCPSAPPLLRGEVVKYAELILSGKDPVFHVDGEIQQEEREVPPHLRNLNPMTSPLSLWQKVMNRICNVISSIWTLMSLCFRMRG